MKLKETIDMAGRMKPNTVDYIDAVGWINTLDGIIHEEILSRAEDYTGEFTPYTEADDEAELLVPFPYDSIYIDYLSAKIDFANGEIASYNNNMTLYNKAYDNFANYYRRNHMPKSGV